MSETIKPLNGEKTHPLSAHAHEELENISWHPLPTLAVNPGVINRLIREGLVVIVDLPSPFRAHRGGTCAHLEITEAGRNKLKELEAQK